MTFWSSGLGRTPCGCGTSRCPRFPSARPPPAASLLRTGVDMFFVLSGFLIGHMWLKEVNATGAFRYVWARLLPCPARPSQRPPTRPSIVRSNTAVPCRYHRFLARRFLRIWPMLVVGLAYTMAVNADGQRAVCAEDWWSILLFVNNYVAPSQWAEGWSGQGPCMPHLW